MSNPTTSRPRFELTDYKVSAPSQYGRGKTYLKQVWADAGAVKSQGGNAAVKSCDCGALVCWVKSAKTGKSYLAHVYRYASGNSYYYVKASVHTSEAHADRLAGRAALDLMVVAAPATKAAETYELFTDCVAATPASIRYIVAMVMSMVDDEAAAAYLAS